MFSSIQVSEVVNLYNGNNEQYYEQCNSLEQMMPHNWTNSPLEALRFAYNSAKRHDSKMLVVALEDVNLDVLEELVRLSCEHMEKTNP